MSSFFRVLRGLELHWTDFNGVERHLKSPNVTQVTTQFLGSHNSKTCNADRFEASRFTCTPVYVWNGT